mmetsp:Transcript_1521/g.4597  ORF Transcript_1521/g.4597 Transcript_1521/m.4597 type:complete len:202 (-) Transcript_1521:27-632(-)
MIPVTAVPPTKPSKATAGARGSTTAAAAAAVSESDAAADALATTSRHSPTQTGQHRSPSTCSRRLARRGSNNESPANLAVSPDDDHTLESRYGIDCSRATSASLSAVRRPDPNGLNPSRDGSNGFTVSPRPNASSRPRFEPAARELRVGLDDKDRRTARLRRARSPFASESSDANACGRTSSPPSTSPQLRPSSMLRFAPK